MTLDQLIETLQDLRETMDDDAPVLVATQPSWPMQLGIEGMVLVTPDDDPSGEMHEPVLYLETSDGSEYLHGAATVALGW